MVGIVILFPGSFKPFHLGHLILLHKYIKYAMENYRTSIQVKVIISKKDRDFINANSTIDFLESIKKYLNCDFEYWFNQKNPQFIEYKNVTVDCHVTEYDSPIQECYRIVNECKARDTKFMLVASDKSFDLNRQTEMIKQFNYAGKYFKGYNKMLKTNPNVVAQVKIGGKTINATYLRDCIKLDAKNGFAECYGKNFDKETIDKYFDNLRNLYHEKN